MKCYLDNNEAVTYCKVCKRPICEKCSNEYQGICRKCHDYSNKQFKQFYKKSIIHTLIYLIIFPFVFYDAFLYTTGFFKGDFRFLPYGFIMLFILSLPVYLSIRKYGLKNGIIILIKSTEDKELIVYNNRTFQFNDLLQSTIILGILYLTSIVIAPALFICSVIKLGYLIKNIIKYRK